MSDFSVLWYRASLRKLHVWFRSTLTYCIPEIAACLIPQFTDPEHLWDHCISDLIFQPSDPMHPWDCCMSDFSALWPNASLRSLHVWFHSILTQSIPEIAACLIPQPSDTMCGISAIAAGKLFIVQTLSTHQSYWCGYFVIGNVHVL